MGTCMDNMTQQEEHIFCSTFESVPVPDNLTLPEFVLQDAELYEDKVAFVDVLRSKEITYGEVIKNTKRFATALRSLGLRKGHVVVVLLPNVAEYATIALGIMTAGGVFSGANPAAHISEIKKQIETSDAKLIITDGVHYEKVKVLKVPVITIDEEMIEGAMNWHNLLQAGERAGTNNSLNEIIQQTDLCALPFSSGTTGISKGVMLTHRNLIANLCSTLFGIRPEMIGKVTVLGLMPFFHIYGIAGICCAALKNKGKVVVMGRYELRTFMNALITQEINFAPIVPPIISDMVKKPMIDEFDLTKLKLQAIMTAAAPLAPELLKIFETKFPGVQVQEAYGLTEHSCITLTHGDPEKGKANSKRNSVGFIIPNLEVKFIDPETGYYNNDEETKRTIDKNGWLHTGDIGYIDDDGDIFIVDRIKELIKYKGFQVAPAELEAVLLTHPSIEDAAVFPLPNEEAGEIPAASVVMASDSKETEEEIINYVASNVASYKKLRLVQFVENIPKSPSGKIMRRLLRDELIKKMQLTS